MCTIYGKPCHICPLQAQDNIPSHVRKNINTWTHVFIRNDNIPSSLVIYSGPYKVTKKDKKYFVLDIVFHWWKTKYCLYWLPKKGILWRGLHDSSLWSSNESNNLTNTNRNHLRFCTPPPHQTGKCSLTVCKIHSNLSDKLKLCLPIFSNVIFTSTQKKQIVCFSYGYKQPKWLCITHIQIKKKIQWIFSIHTYIKKKIFLHQRKTILTKYFTNFFQKHLIFLLIPYMYICFALFSKCFPSF